MLKPFPAVSVQQVITAGILTACASNSLAAGFALIEQSASQMGNAFAGGAASANDASTIFFNPAGLTRLPHQLVGALHVVHTSAKFSGSATDLLGNPVVSGGNGGDAGTTGLVPNLYYALPLGNDLFLGLGINAPFGLSTEYDDDWKGRYHAIESEVATININPSLAYKLNNQFSIGVGVSMQYIDAKLTQKIDQGSLCIPTLMAPPPAGAGLDAASAAAACAASGLTPQNNDAFAKIKGDDWAMGFNAGLLFEPRTGTRIGLAYRSEVKQQLTGDGTFRNANPLFTGNNVFVDTDVTAKVDLPQSASLSIYQDINNQWSVMADATWTGWNSFDELRIKYDSFQPDTVVDESWNNSMRYAVGLDYRHNSAWTFRAGLAYDKTPIPNARHRTARIPGEDRTWVSLGFGYQATPSVHVDVGYSHLFVEDPKINNSEDTAGTLSGDYDASVDILSAQLVWDI